MRDNNTGGKIFSVVLIAIAALVLVIIMIQLNSVEKRFIALNARVTELESKAGSFSSNQNINPNLSPETPEHKHEYLHPEVPNFLKQPTFSIRTPQTKDGGILRRWYTGEPKSFNNLITSDGELNNTIGTYVFAESFGTTQFDDPTRWIPELAERIEITDDYKEYTIYLKKNIKWHKPVVDWSNKRYDWLKGDHYLTAEDVKFTVDMILNPQVECPALRNYYQDLEEVKIIDPHVVVFRWKKKTYQSINFTVGFGYTKPKFIFAYDEDGKPFEESVAGLKFNNHWYNNRPIGCGPYEFVSYEQGSSVKLKRFEDYYGEKPAIKEIYNLIYPDSKQNLLKIKSRAQDFGIMYATEYREEILNAKPDSIFKSGQINVGGYDETAYRYTGYNMDCPLFKDKKVRWAMSHAFNLPYVMKNIYMDQGTPVSGPLYFRSPGYDSSIKPVDYDLNKSRKLLEEAGWKDTDRDGIIDKIIDGKKRPFEFSILVVAGIPEVTATMNIYKEDLLKLGIKMNISEVDWALWQKRVEDRDFDALIGVWGMPWEQDPYQIWHSSQASIPKSSNHISYRNPEADKVIEKLRETFDQQERIKLYNQFHRLIYEDQPYTFWFNNKRCAVWWNNLDNVIFTPLRPYSKSTPWYFSSPEPR